MNAANNVTNGNLHPCPHVQLAQLTGHQFDIVDSAAARLDAAEKIVISACARSLHDLDNPPELVLDLMNLLYEEALHLETIGRLLGIHHGERDWITDDRQGNWRLVLECARPVEYMIAEHCLYEGRGTIASAAGVFQLERAGASTDVIAAMEVIAMQEAGHNITGFRWLRLLDKGGDEDERLMATVVRKFVSVEPLPLPDGSSRSAKKYFPLYLFHQYRKTGDFYRVKSEIVAASKNARRTGEPGVPIEELYSAGRQVLSWCEGA
jgi:hypothetical protein